MLRQLCRYSVPIEKLLVTTIISKTYVILENVHILRGLVDDVIPNLVGEHHEPFDERILLVLVGAGRDHVTHRLVKSVHLK